MPASRRRHRARGSVRSDVPNFYAEMMARARARITHPSRKPASSSCAAAAALFGPSARAGWSDEERRNDLPYGRAPAWTGVGPDASPGCATVRTGTRRAREVSPDRGAAPGTPRAAHRSSARGAAATRVWRALTTRCQQWQRCRPLLVLPCPPRLRGSRTLRHVPIAAGSSNPNEHRTLPGFSVEASRRARAMRCKTPRAAGVWARQGAQDEDGGDRACRPARGARDRRRHGTRRERDAPR